MQLINPLSLQLDLILMGLGGIIIVLAALLGKTNELLRSCESLLKTMAILLASREGKLSDGQLIALMEARAAQTDPDAPKTKISYPRSLRFDKDE